jgi:hypothetical protein
MSDSCSQCGAEIPSGQGICSMCYGDVAYGNDGHYQRYLEEAEADAWEQKLFDESEYVEIGEDDDEDNDVKDGQMP